MDVSIETALELATLQQWAEQSPVLDLADIYDELRGGLTRTVLEYGAARARGVRGQEDADAAVAEMQSLTTLLDAVVESLLWRRGIYAAKGQPWPLVTVEDVQAPG